MQAPRNVQCHLHNITMRWVICPAKLSRGRMQHCTRSISTCAPRLSQAYSSWCCHSALLRSPPSMSSMIFKGNDGMISMANVVIEDSRAEVWLSLPAAGQA